LLGTQPKRVKISVSNAIPEFKQALAVSDEIAEIEEASKQMGEVVRSLITDSFGDSNYNRAAENIGVMREELIDMEEPEFYNIFIKDLKKRLLSGELGGDRREMWWDIKISRLGLIDQEQSDVSTVTTAEADEVRLPNSVVFLRC
jgi:ATP-dependent DNA helicase 2 subunit 2